MCFIVYIIIFSIHTENIFQIEKRTFFIQFCKKKIYKTYRKKVLFYVSVVQNISIDSHNNQKNQSENSQWKNLVVLTAKKEYTEKLFFFLPENIEKKLFYIVIIINLHKNEILTIKS